MTKLASWLTLAVASPNAQLRQLNIHVSKAQRDAVCGFPTQLTMGGSGERISEHSLGLACGVSSFGFSGTLANFVVRAVRAEPQLACVLSYKRRHFAWNDASLQLTLVS